LRFETDIRFQICGCGSQVALANRQASNNRE